MPLEAVAPQRGVEKKMEDVLGGKIGMAVSDHTCNALRDLDLSGKAVLRWPHLSARGQLEFTKIGKAVNELARNALLDLDLNGKALR